MLSKTKRLFQNLLSRAQRFVLILASASGLLWFLVAVLAVLGFAGLGVAVASWWVTWSSAGSPSLCLGSECITEAETLFTGPLAMLNLTGQVTILIATVGGILIALFSFFHTSRVSAFGNHVSHISIFSTYLNYEVSKRDRISPASVDIYGLYSLMFSRSRGGSMELSDEYIGRFNNLVRVIEESNMAYARKAGDGFNLRVHQAKLKKALRDLKIQCEITHHRVDFIEIESQIFDLIDSLSVVFCADSRVGRLPVRDYV